MSLDTFVYCLGLVTCASLSYKAIDFALLHFYRPASSLERYKHGKEHWALVTGASDGIGYGYAQELVQRGFGVILLARNGAKLETTKEKLERECPGAKLRILVVDAQFSSASDVSGVIETVKDLNITILINNIGGLPFKGKPYFKPYSEYSSAEIDDFISVNARFAARITNLTLPLFARTKKPCLVLNITSAAEIGIPRLCMYSATKGFINSFSRALARECKTDGLPVDVLIVTPADVQSNGQRIPVSMIVPSSRHFARDTLDKAGWAVKSGRLEFKPSVFHDLAIGVLARLPESVRREKMAEEIMKKTRFYDNLEDGGKKDL